MKRVKREQKYIGFVLGMLVMMLLCFGLVCVTAEPTEETSPSVEVSADPGQVAAPTENPTEEISEVPTADATEVPTDASTQDPTELVTQAPTEETVAIPTVAPTQGPTENITVAPTDSVAGTTQTPVLSATPSEELSTVVTPTGSPDSSGTVTPIVPTTPMDTTPPFTMGPINWEDMLPESSPQVTPGKTETSEETTLNMNGYVLRIAATWDEYQDTCLDLEAISAFEQKYNCQVQFLDLSEETLYNRLLMSCATDVTYFDAILVEGTEILVNLEPLGLLQSFSQYMTEAELAALPVSYQKFLAKDNVLYGIPAKAPDVSGIWYNASMVQKYLYTDPLPFYNQRTWTWYQFTSFLREATRDLDNDGYYDTYGIATSSPWYFSVLESIRGSLFRWDGSQFLPSATNSISVQALSFAHKVYSSHFVASDYERYFYSGRTPYLAGELSMYTELNNWMTEKELIFLPYPSASGAEPYTTVATSVPCAAITATATYPEQTAELLKLLYGGDALTTRIETYCAQSGFSDQIKAMYYTMLENFTVDYTNAFDSSGMLQTTILSFLKNQTTEAGTVEMYIQPLLEQAIAEKQKEIDLTKVPVEIRW